MTTFVSTVSPLAEPGLVDPARVDAGPLAQGRSASAQVCLIPVDLLQPGRMQSRRHFDPQALAELADSIRESGIIQPLVVRGDRRGYELLAGERRWRAAQLAGLHEVPVLIRNDLSDDEAEVLGLVENLQREALSPMETAVGLKALGQRYQLTHEAIGARIGKSRVYVTNFLRLLGLDEQVQQWIDQGALTLGHAKVLAGLSGHEQRALAAQAVAETWSVRALERRARSSAHGALPRGAGASADRDHQRLVQQLAEQLGYPVRLEMDGAQRGELRLRFHSLDEFEGLLMRLGIKLDV